MASGKEEEVLTIVHLDVNKTILAADAAAGLDERQALSSAVARCVWGVAIPVDAGPVSSFPVDDDGFVELPHAVAEPAAPGSDSSALPLVSDLAALCKSSFLPLLPLGALLGDRWEEVAHGLLPAHGPREVVGAGEAEEAWVVLDPSVLESNHVLREGVCGLFSRVCEGDEKPAVDAAFEAQVRSLPRVRNTTECIPLSRWIDDWVLPYAEEVGCEARGLSIASVRAFNHEAKEACKEAVRAAFEAETGGERGIGSVVSTSVFPSAGVASAWKPAVQRLLRALALSGGRPSRATGLAALDAGRVHLVPAYFQLLRWLSAQEAAGKGRFAVVVRTFGSDVPEVIAEHNLFCSGRHPAEERAGGGGEGGGEGGGGGGRDGGGVGREGDDDDLSWLSMRVPLNTGRFVRWDEPGLKRGAGIALAWPTLVVGDGGAESDEAGAVDIARGAHDVHDALLHRIRRGHHAFAIRDDYPYWKRNDETGHAGKLLLLPSADTDPIEFQIFFDDNISHTSPDIVDARDQDGNEIDFHLVNGTHLFRAEIALALASKDYFVKCLQQARTAFLQRRASKKKEDE